MALRVLSGLLTAFINEETEIQKGEVICPQLINSCAGMQIQP